MSDQKVAFRPFSLAASLVLFCATCALPSLANALGMTEIRGVVSPFLYGTIGFFGALAVLAFGSGFVLYLVRIGTDQRVEGIDIMIWGVTILFVVIILIGILALVE